jgi:hypothetical protein
MTLEEVREELKELVLRMKALQERGPSAPWQWDAILLKNDTEELGKRFAEGSPERQAIDNALDIMPFGSDDEWVPWWNDYGTPLFKALVLAGYRLKKGQAVLADDSPDEVMIEADTPHSAYVKIRDIVEQASITLTIVDPWVSRELFPLLTNVDRNVNVRILTRQDIPKDFGPEAAKFAKQHGMTIEVRTGLGDSHDRFLVVDNRLFNSGASLKDLGKKLSVVTEITSVKQAIIDEIEKRWKVATLV